MNTLQALTITARCACTGHVTIRDVVRMAAYGILAVQASTILDGNRMTYRMHIGAMRGTWRKAYARSMGRRAVALALGV